MSPCENVILMPEVRRMAQIDRGAAVNEVSVTNGKPLEQFTSEHGSAAAKTVYLALYFGFGKCGPLKYSGCWCENRLAIALHDRP